MRKSKRSSSLSRITEQRPSIRANPDENQKIRIARHEKLIEMIRQYSRTMDEEDRLRRMRKNTVMEIDLRFKNSKENKSYVFPKKDSKDSENGSDTGEQAGMRQFSRNVYYDLHSQNQIPREPSQSQFLEVSRRVKSLDQVSGGIRSQKLLKKIGRLQTDLDSDQQKYKTNIMANFKRSKTLVKESTSSNHLILPILSKKIQNLKTETNQNGRNKIQKLMMKKLITQAYNPNEYSPSKGYERRAIHNRRK